MKRSKTTLQGNLKPPQDSLLGGFLRLAFQPFSHIDLNRSQLAGENTAPDVSGWKAVNMGVQGLSATFAAQDGFVYMTPSARGLLLIVK